MASLDEADRLTAATRAYLEADGGGTNWAESVRIGHVGATVEAGQLVVRIRFTDTRAPGDQLGAAFEVGEMFWTENGGELDHEWAATHALIYLGEATFAGGDPRTWTPDADGVRWYRDRMQ